jgi:hypothetical protein
MADRPSLLVLGASGNVARAFLRHLGGHRDRVKNLILLDRNRRLLDDPVLDHGRLNYRFIRHRIEFPKDETWYRRLLRKYRISMVIDLTDIDTLPTLASTDAVGVSYLSTSTNGTNQSQGEVMLQVKAYGDRKTRVPHILGSGMNPGVVNIWARHGVEHFGVPREIVHFEYDTSRPADDWAPIITWSPRQFLSEAVWDASGYVHEGQTRDLPTPAIQQLVNMRSILRPIMKLDEYPEGLLALHEENITLGARWGISSKFIYALLPETMRHLQRIYRTRGTVRLSDLQIGDNNTMPLEGTDTIGVLLLYPQKRVYYVHSLPNAAVVGTNATCAQVAVGVYAGMLTLLMEKLESRIHHPGDLYQTLYRQVVFANMRVARSVFTRSGRIWLRRSHIRQVRVRSVDESGDFVI